MFWLWIENITPIIRAGSCLYSRKSTIRLENPSKQASNFIVDKEILANIQAVVCRICDVYCRETKNYKQTNTASEHHVSMIEHRVSTIERTVGHTPLRANHSVVVAHPARNYKRRPVSWALPAPHFRSGIWERYRQSVMIYFRVRWVRVRVSVKYSDSNINTDSDVGWAGRCTHTGPDEVQLCSKQGYRL